MNHWKQMPPGLTALVEVCLLFLPAIPFYLWGWPNFDSQLQQAAQISTYLYSLAGALFIGLRRWNLEQLGVNRRGIALSLVFGLIMILGRSLVILSINWGLPLPSIHPAALLRNFLYYFAIVGFVEEFVFRGLIYRSFESWLGTRWAIWGSSFGFVLWHIFGWGPLVGGAMLLYGLIFALMRWRAGGILGLILIHGLTDFSATLLLPDLDVLSLGRPEITYPAVMLFGLVLILITPGLLWKFDWLVEHFPFRRVHRQV